MTQGPFTVAVILALSASIMFHLFLLTLVAPKRWRLERAGDVLWGAFLNVLLAAIVTSVFATAITSLVRMAA